MDSSPFSWLSEMGLNSSIFTDESDFMDSFDERLAEAFRHDLEDCLSQGNNSSSSASSTLPNPMTEFNYVPPSKLHKPNTPSGLPIVDQGFLNYDHGIVMPSVPIVLNFENAESSEKENMRDLNPQEEAAISEVLRTQDRGSTQNTNEQSKQKQTTVKKPSRVRPPQQTYDHIIAERKRRELLSQRFVALSTIVPGLKKTDKTSVLGDAIKYLKHLQERVKTLEEQAAKQTMESLVLVKRSQIMLEDDGSSDENSCCSFEQTFPEIEVRICNDNILIRVYCEKKKGTLVNLLETLEMLNLSIVTSHITQFGSNMAFDITIIAEKEKKISLSVKEVVRKLRDAIKPTI